MAAVLQIITTSMHHHDVRRRARRQVSGLRAAMAELEGEAVEAGLLAEESAAEVRCWWHLWQAAPRVWTYRDRSLEKKSRFPVKLSRSGPDKSKRIVAPGGSPGPLGPSTRTHFPLELQAMTWELRTDPRG